MKWNALWLAAYLVTCPFLVGCSGVDGEVESNT